MQLKIPLKVRGERHIDPTPSPHCFKEVHVWSPDTNVFILLIDLTSNNSLEMLTVLKFCTGTGAKYREIDIKAFVQVLGQHKAQGLLELHNFSGSKRKVG